MTDSDASTTPATAPGTDGPPGAAAFLDDLPPDVRRGVLRTLRLSVVEGSLTQTFLNWTSGSVLIGFMLHLGASATEIALVGSVPLLAQVASPFAAYLAEAFGRRRLWTIAMAALSRATWLVAAALPSLAVPDALRPGLMIVLVLVSSSFLAANGTLWTAWMGDVVPERRRGRYFGFRAGVVGVVGMVANLAAGVFLDRVAAPLSFQVTFGVAVAVAAVGVAIYAAQVDPPTPRRRVALRDLFVVPWSHPAYRRFLVFAGYWQFVVLLAAPFVFPYFLQELGMSFTQLAIWLSIAALTALFTSTLWGRVADLAGNKGVLAIGTFLGGALLPGTWILAGVTGRLEWIWLAAVFDAVAWGAIGPALFNLALAAAPSARRVVYIATFSMVTGVAGFVGGALAGPILLGLRALEASAFPAPWSAYHALFALSGLLRMTAWVLLRKVPEARAWRTRDLLRHVRTGWKASGFPWR
jgi:MFS family permease